VHSDEHGDRMLFGDVRARLHAVVASVHADDRVVDLRRLG
jgi:hypothetical protein